MVLVPRMSDGWSHARAWPLASWNSCLPADEGARRPSPQSSRTCAVAAAQPRPQAGPPTDHEHRCERMSAPTSPERLSLPSRPRRRRCDPHRGNGPTGHCCELILTAARACPNPYATPGIDRPFVLFCVTACCAPLALRTVSQRVQRKHIEIREKYSRASRAPIAP